MSCAEAAGHDPQRQQQRRYVSVAEGNISLPVTFVLAAGDRSAAAVKQNDEEEKRTVKTVAGGDENVDPLSTEKEPAGRQTRPSETDGKQQQQEYVIKKRPDKMQIDEKCPLAPTRSPQLAPAPALMGAYGEPPKAAAQYPLIYVAPTGNMSVMLQPNTIVEVAVDRALRVICHGKFAAAVNARGSSSCIMHEHARIYQEDTRVFCQFGAKAEKKAVFGSSGVLFALAGSPEAFLVSASAGGTTRVPFCSSSFPTLESDFSIPLFFLQSETGEHLYAACEELVGGSHYDRLADGTVVISLHGVHIRHRAATTGEIDISCRPRHVRLLPAEGKVSVRSHYIDMGVVEADKFFVKRGVKRVHVSKSGIVASDGNCVASIDDHGQLVSNS